MLIRIDDIYPMMEARAYKELEALMQGSVDFVNPVVLLRTIREEWLEYKKSKANFILDPPDIDGEILQVICGHNRIELYKQSGRTVIKCVVFDSREEAAEECRRQSNWHKRQWGAL